MILRPHHGLCLLHFVGKGYDETFIRQMRQIHAHLAQHPDEIILLRCEKDALCHACPNHTDAGCQTQQKVQALDAACLSACRLSEGASLSWACYADLLRTHVLRTGRLEKICRACQWFSLCQSIQMDAKG